MAFFIELIFSFFQNIEIRFNLSIILNQQKLDTEIRLKENNNSKIKQINFVMSNKKSMYSILEELSSCGKIFTPVVFIHTLKRNILFIS